MACDYGLIMNPVKPVWPPETRPGCEELPVTLTESPADSSAVALQEATSAGLFETQVEQSTSSLRIIIISALSSLAWTLSAK